MLSLNETKPSSECTAAATSGKQARMVECKAQTIGAKLQKTNQLLRNDTNIYKLLAKRTTLIDCSVIPTATAIPTAIPTATATAIVTATAIALQALSNIPHCR